MSRFSTTFSRFVTDCHKNRIKITARMSCVFWYNFYENRLRNDEMAFKTVSISKFWSSRGWGNKPSGEGIRDRNYWYGKKREKLKVSSTGEKVEKMRKTQSLQYRCSVKWSVKKKYCVLLVNRVSEILSKKQHYLSRNIWKKVQA